MSQQYSVYFAPAGPKISWNYIDLSFVYVSVWSPGLIRARGRNWVWLNKLMTILMRLCQGSRDTCLHREHSKRYHVKLLKKKLKSEVMDGVGGHLLATQLGGLCLFSGQPLWDLRWAESLGQVLLHLLQLCFVPVLLPMLHACISFTYHGHNTDFTIWQCH